ncbi:MAG: hypothetical protein ACTSSG_00445 [Candidatus Heimdallarchaeaceae archaeon]
MSISWYILGGLFFLSALITLIIGASARKIDFSDRIFRPHLRERFSGRSKEKVKKKSKAKRSRAAPFPSPQAVEEVYKEKDEEIETERRILDSIPEESEKLDEQLDYVKVPASSRTSGDFQIPPPSPEIYPSEETELIGEKADNFSRDLAIQLPKNMCLEEVFRLRITISRTDKYTSEVEMKELDLSEKEAEYFSLSVKKLGEKVVETTTRLEGLKNGNLTIRPIAIGNVAVISPAQRTIFFDQDEQEYVVEFFITPTKYSKDLASILRIEFEQEYRNIKTINIPMKIYKHKFEAIFGLNISKWQQNVLFVYSGLGTIAGIISSMQDKVVPFFQHLFS